jgi:hypothetical protein
MVSQNVRYLAQLHGVEGNALLEVLPGLVALGGVRWIDLDESVRFESLGFFEINTWKTENRMIGPQVGGRVELAQLLGHESSPWSVAGDFRAAALFNEANAHFKNARGGSNPFGDDRENDVGVGIQSSLTVGYELVDGVVLQVGYQVLWLSSVATATAQIGGTPDFGVSGEIGVDVRHDAVLYHGGTVGVTIALP